MGGNECLVWHGIEEKRKVKHFGTGIEEVTKMRRTEYLI